MVDVKLTPWVKVISVLLCSCLLFFSNSMYAESRGEEIYNIHIINNTTYEVYFRLRPKNGKWGKFYLEGRARAAYGCEKCEEYEFELDNNRETIKYRLTATKIYQIEWNRARGIFDLYTVKD